MASIIVAPLLSILSVGKSTYGSDVNVEFSVNPDIES